jgi:uncharacterized membrane protein YvbJ
MALMKCPECGKEVSDKAANCPNCGYKITDNIGHVKNPYHGKKIMMLGLGIVILGSISLLLTNSYSTWILLSIIGIILAVIGKAMYWFHN